MDVICITLCTCPKEVSSMEQYVKGFKGFTPLKMCGLSPLASFNVILIKWFLLQITICSILNIYRENFFSPKAAIILVSTEYWDLAALQSHYRKSTFNALAIQIWQIWLPENCRMSALHMLKNWDQPGVSIAGADQKDCTPWRWECCK